MPGPEHAALGRLEGLNGQVSFVSWRSFWVGHGQMNCGASFWNAFSFGRPGWPCPVCLWQPVLSGESETILLSTAVESSWAKAKASLTSSVTGPVHGVASPMAFEGSPMLHLLSLNLVARSGARGVRHGKQRRENHHGARSWVRTQSEPMGS